MAKTRIKTTPTRMQKEALMASSAVTTTTNIVTEHVFKKRLSVLKNSITSKETSTPIQSTIIVQPPKRTNSISSATSTISHTSDGRSCNGSPPPAPPISTHSNIPATLLSNGPTMAELTENAIKTLNAGLLAKSNALAMKNRKVYMITERCDDSNSVTNNNGSGVGGGTGGGTGGTGKGQKRKMYLIMEEKESGDKNGSEHTEKLIKSENNGNKKLTLFTDTNNGQLPQKFEKILPEILNCIQAKKDAEGERGGGGLISLGTLGDKIESTIAELNNKPVTTNGNNSNSKLSTKSENNERLPLTLPPKKNRTKIITTQIIPVNPTTQAIYNSNGLEVGGGGGAGVVGITGGARITSHYSTHQNGFCKSEKSVIVNANTLMHSHSNGNNGSMSKENGNTTTPATITATTATQLHKNINLSTDFLFLMKMLPKLESIEEPQKMYVKNCIEDIINQYAPAADAANQFVDQQ